MPADSSQSERTTDADDPRSGDPTAITLATKCYVEGQARERALDSLDSLLRNDLGSLSVSHRVDLQESDFPLVHLEGADATVARNLLAAEWGQISPDPPTEGTAWGTVQSWDDDALELDAARVVRIQAEDLGLGPGSASQIRQRFGLVQHVPLAFETGDRPRLAEPTCDRLYDWQRGNGRVNVNSATRAEVRATVNRAGHAQDIVTVERLGLLEQSIVCRESTDPPGLLASIGEYLPAELLCVV